MYRVVTSCLLLIKYSITNAESVYIDKNDKKWGFSSGITLRKAPLNGQNTVFLLIYRRDKPIFKADARLGRLDLKQTPLTEIITTV
jgi:hypothetical protein